MGAGDHRYAGRGAQDSTFCDDGFLPRSSQIVTCPWQKLRVSQAAVMISGSFRSTVDRVVIQSPCWRVAGSSRESRCRAPGGEAAGRVLAPASRRLLRLDANASMSFSPERRKSRKSSPLYLHVSQMLSRIKYSRIPFSVLHPPMTFLSVAKALTACSALLLFQGTPSKLKNVNNFSRFFWNRSLNFTAPSLWKAMVESCR